MRLGSFFIEYLLTKSSSLWKVLGEVHEWSKELIHSLSPQESGVLQLSLVLCATYVFTGCPYLTQVSATICLVSFTIMLLGYHFANAEIWRVFHNGGYERILQFIRSPKFCITAFLVYLTAKLLKTYINDCVDISRKQTEVGFVHLSEEARRRGETTSSFANKVLNRRDPGILPPVFPNGWVPVMESRDLKVKEVKAVFVLATELVVFRGESKTAFVFGAFCPHLGANFAAGGRVKRDCLECPFHGWKFRGNDGVCVSIPYSNKVPEAVRATTFTSCEVNGFIYVWHHAEKEPPSWEIPEIPNIGKRLWVYRGRSEHGVRCHIQEIPENGADMAHFNQVHESSVYSRTWINYLLDPLLRNIKHAWEPSWEPQPSPYKHTAKLSLCQRVEAFGYQVPFTQLKMEVKQIGPATVHIEIDCVFGRGILIQNIIPKEPLQQCIVHQLYTEFSFRQWYSNLFLSLEAEMVERDITIWNNKKFLKNPVLVKEDRNINRFRKWYSQFYSENSPKLSDFEPARSRW